MKQFFILLFIIFIIGALWITCQRNSNQNNSSEKAGDLITDPSINMEMIFIPAGTFIMGNDHGPDDEDILRIKLNLHVSHPLRWRLDLCIP